jgi:hypothetical protein
MLSLLPISPTQPSLTSVLYCCEPLTALQPLSFQLTFQSLQVFFLLMLNNSQCLSVSSGGFFSPASMSFM